MTKEVKENTIIKIAFDEKYLYIGAVLYDSEPNRIKAYKMNVASCQERTSGDPDRRQEKQLHGPVVS